MNKWELSRIDGNLAVVDSKTRTVIFYINDLPYKTVVNIVELNNKGTDLSGIDQMLLNDEECTQDEREFIIESISNYINLEKMEENKAIDSTADIAAVIPGFATEPGSPAPVEKTKRQWTRRITDGNAPIKAQSTAEFIKIMQEKIEMARMLDAVVLPDIPGSMTKNNRDIMVEFQKEHSQLVVKYMQKIQQA
jgi:hypothetical protein